jgi:NitT/TauT family transport system permease protein
MLIVILLYDQLLFRPLLAWSRKFRGDTDTEEYDFRPWFLTVMQRARFFDLLQSSVLALNRGFDRAINAMSWRWSPAYDARPASPAMIRFCDLALLAVASAAVVWLFAFVREQVSGEEIGWVFLLGALTALRIIVLIVIASLIWVPIGVWIGLRPALARRAQPIVQFLAAFPANLFFPIAVVLILRLHLDVEIWISPLMILGTQWYILFNVIAGASAIPSDLHYAARNLGVARALWWRRVALPAIFPSYITGALTAAGGSWNASIVSEVVRWGDTTLTATGIGAYIARATDAGDFPRIALGIGVLCLYVILLNRLLWRRLYDLAAERLRLD